MLYRQQQIKVLHYTYFETYCWSLQNIICCFLGFLSFIYFLPIELRESIAALTITASCKQAVAKLGASGPPGEMQQNQKEMICWRCDGVPSMLLQEAVQLETTDGLGLNGSESTILIPTHL